MKRKMKKKQKEMEMRVPRQRSHCWRRAVVTWVRLG